MRRLLRRLGSRVSMPLTSAACAQVWQEHWSTPIWLEAEIQSVSNIPFTLHVVTKEKEHSDGTNAEPPTHQPIPEVTPEGMLPFLRV